jgi:hypothetical protein
MKPLSGDKQPGLLLKHTTSQNAKTKIPSTKNDGPGCKSHAGLTEESGEVFFLDILFHRMSVMGI